MDCLGPVLVALLAGGPPVYVGTPSGTCVGTAVQISSTAPAHIKACIGGLWTDITPGGSGSGPGGASQDLQINNGSGGFGGYGGTFCDNGFGRVQSSGGNWTCNLVDLVNDIAPTTALGTTNETAAPPSGSVQYNSGGFFAGSANFTYDGSSVVGLSDGSKIRWTTDTDYVASTQGTLFVEGGGTSSTGSNVGYSSYYSGVAMSANYEWVTQATVASRTTFDSLFVVATNTQSTGNWVGLVYKCVGDVPGALIAQTLTHTGGWTSGTWYASAFVGGNVTLDAGTYCIGWMSDTAPNIAYQNVAGHFEYVGRAFNLGPLNPFPGSYTTYNAPMACYLHAAQSPGIIMENINGGAGMAVSFRCAGATAAGIDCSGVYHGTATALSRGALSARVTGADYTNSTTTPSTIASWTVGSGEIGSFRCTLEVNNANAASAIRYNITGPSVTSFAYEARHKTTSVTTDVIEVFTSTSASAQTAAVTSGVATTTHIDIIEGAYNASAAGTFAVQGSASTATDASTVYQGSSCQLY